MEKLYSGNVSSIEDLFLAIKEKNVGKIENLITTIDINETDIYGRTPLYYAVSVGVDMVNLLLKYGASPYVENKCKETLLHEAARENQDVINLLLNLHERYFKFKINSKNCCGETPLHIAVKMGNIETVRYLLELGAEHLVADYGRTPLHYAVKYGRDEIYQILIESGADPDAVDFFGMKPCDLP